jgi:DNA-binding transcriptional LysR family regulator
MEFRHLRYLVALADELHFGRAALRLHISQPPLSQQIRQLEKELGVQLFERTNRKVRLTDAGRRLVDEANLVLGSIDHISRIASQAGGGEIGHLSVGVTGSINQALIDTMRLLGRKHPAVRIELQYMSTGTQVEALREGRIDIGFLSLPIHDPTLILEKTKTEPLWIAMPKTHPLARVRKVPPSSLANQDIILFPRRVTPGLHDTITNMCSEAGFTLNVVHEVDSMVGGLTLVSAGLGIAFTTPDAQKLWPDIAFRPIESSVTVEQGIAYNREAMSPVLETFLHALRETLRKSTKPKRQTKSPIPTRNDPGLA